MSSWKIKSVRKTTDDEVKNCCEKLIKHYEKELDVAKEAKKTSNKEIFETCRWSCLMHASFLTLLASLPLFGVQQDVGVVTLFSSLGGIGASTIGAALTGTDALFADETKEKMKQSFVASKHAKKQIKNLKRKIKVVEEKAQLR